MQIYSYAALSELQKKLVIDFLRNYEMSCVQLCSVVRKGENGVFVCTKDHILANSSQIFGVFQIRGHLLHCFPFSLDDSFFPAFREICKDKNIQCVNGEASASDKLIAFLEGEGKKCFHKNQYHLMTLRDSASNNLVTAKEILDSGAEFVSCSMNETDKEELFPLQKNYLKEEVSPGHKTPSDMYVSATLSDILKNQKVFAIRMDDQLVAKANTNAIGWNYIQLGGIYTHPLYRRNGYAQVLVSSLARRIISGGRTVSLFVNKKNPAAINLYSKLGFAKQGDYVIAYF